MSAPIQTWFMKYQANWIADRSPLRIVEKSRQIGFSYADAYDSVVLAGAKGASLDVWITSRDQIQAQEYLRYCRTWAKVLQMAASDMGEEVIDEKGNKAFVLEFSNGKRIFSLSSNFNAIAGKTGHVKADEFALHDHQRELYRIAEPATTWGGTLSLLSTHRGVNSVYNQILRDIKERGNPMGWSHHRVTIHDAVEQGIVERINAKAKTNWTREEWVAMKRSRCIDEEQWQQEYCCQPADENSAFLTYDLITPAECDCLKALDYLRTTTNPLWAGIDVARKHDLTVIDVGELIGDVMWDRLRIEMRGAKFAEQEQTIDQVLSLPTLRRCAMDATGIGAQLAERAGERYGHRVLPVTFTAGLKEDMAWTLRRGFEDRRLRIDNDPKLRADLRGIRKESGPGDSVRFVGDAEDSHCDRFWAKALREYARNQRAQAFAMAA